MLLFPLFSSLFAPCPSQISLFLALKKICLAYMAPRLRGRLPCRGTFCEENGRFCVRHKAPYLGGDLGEDVCACVSAALYTASGHPWAKNARGFFVCFESCASLTQESGGKPRSPFTFRILTMFIHLPPRNCSSGFSLSHTTSSPHRFPVQIVAPTVQSERDFFFFLRGVLAVV